MLPVWNTTLGDYGNYETSQQILDMNMKSCNKSAVILNENMALFLNTTSKHLKTSLLRQIYCK